MRDMSYAIRVQTTGTRLFSCKCGAISKHAVKPQNARVQCRTCHRSFVLGTVVYEVTSDPRGAASLQPADLAISADALRRALSGADRQPVASGAAGSSQAAPAEEVASPYIPREPATRADEPTIAGGVWRSGEPITLEMPRTLNQLWRDKQDSSLYIAASTCMGTRYVVQRMDADNEERTCVSAREWRAAAERIS